MKSHSGDVSADRRFQERNSSYCNNDAHFGKLWWHRAKREAEGEAEDLQVGLWLKRLLTNCACVCLQPKCIHHTAAVCLLAARPDCLSYVTKYFWQHDARKGCSL